MPKVKKTCQRCGEEFEVPQCRKNTAKYCSLKCSPNGFTKGHKFRNTGRTRYKKGHISWSKLHPNLMPKGVRNYMWKGGKQIDKTGYILILNRNHPFCNKAGYIREHRLVVESQLNRYLSPEEKVHHLGEKDDNRPQMLIAFVNDSAHQRFHHNEKNVKQNEIIFDGRLLESNNL